MTKKRYSASLSIRYQSVAAVVSRVLPKEGSMRGWIRVLGAGAIVVLSAWTAAAQSGASISGVVRDPSGAVLPGVTVEAASPVLIEKV